MGWRKHDREQDNYLQSSCYVLADACWEALHSNQEAGEPGLAENTLHLFAIPLAGARPWQLPHQTFARTTAHGEQKAFRSI